MRSPRTTMKRSPCSLQLEKARVQQRRPDTAKSKYIKFIKKKKKKALRKDLEEPSCVVPAARRQASPTSSAPQGVSGIHPCIPAPPSLPPRPSAPSSCTARIDRATSVLVLGWRRGWATQISSGSNLGTCKFCVYLRSHFPNVCVHVSVL